MESSLITLQCQKRHPQDIEFLHDWGNEWFYYLNNHRLSLARSLLVLNKSPSGFAHGYGGSGPAQLALAICTELYGQEEALAVFQTFKQQYIARLPEGEFMTTLSVPLPRSDTKRSTGHPFRTGDLVQVDQRFNPSGKVGYIYSEYKGVNDQLGVNVLLEDGTDLGGFSYDEQQNYLSFLLHKTPIYQFNNNAQLYRNWQEGWFENVFKGAVAGVNE
ncbi:MAG: DUF6166 domain-containing protein [Bacteroidota bacterium]